jgi:hypothetical protein
VIIHRPSCKIGADPGWQIDTGKKTNTAEKTERNEARYLVYEHRFPTLCSGFLDWCSKGR